MPRDKANSRSNDDLYVISLKRTPQRLESFYERNADNLREWNVHVIYGVDGTEQKEVFKQSRLVSDNVLKSWSPGAIGSALSHMLSWRKCLHLEKPIVVVEDDAILARKMKQNLNTMLKDGNGMPPFLLLGWNLDSLLQAELEQGLGIISLFEPAYPEEKELKRLVNSKTERQSCKLKRCFGLPAYRITPAAAKYLLKHINPLIGEEISMGRGIPTHFSETLDGLLNNQYEKIGAKIVFPPLALALNKQNESLTRKRKTQDFQD